MVLKDNRLICGDYRNNNYSIDLKTFTCEKFQFEEGSCFYLDKYKEEFLALIIRSPIDDDLQIMQYDGNFESVSEIALIPKISSSTFQMTDDKIFFVEDGGVRCFDPEKKSYVCE